MMITLNVAHISCRGAVEGQEPRQLPGGALREPLPIACHLIALKTWLGQLPRPLGQPLDGRHLSMRHPRHRGYCRLRLAQ